MYSEKSMKKHCLFLAKSTSLLQDAQEEALRIGLEELYVIQEITQERWLLGGTTSQDIPLKLDHLELLSELSEVNWEHQSALFSPYYKEGRIRIPLNDFSSSLAVLDLLPGAGFGDLSHPTTRLMLRTMEEQVKNRFVLDIGCGNGILSLAASHMGALYTNGIDIDEEALSHAEGNKQIPTEKYVDFSSTPTLTLQQAPSWVALMNMTFLEQKAAWGSLAPWHKKITTLVVSGILCEQADKYLEWMKQNNFEPLSSSEEDGWACFVLNSIYYLRA